MGNERGAEANLHRLLNTNFADGTALTVRYSRAGATDSKIQEIRRHAEKRCRRNRWSASGRARVIHPVYGEAIVPCASKFAAILCAAEVWKCDWAKIMDAEVWRYEG